MQVMVSESELKGEMGFALTKLYMATNLIEKADRKIFKSEKFLEKVGENEIFYGIHFMKRWKKSYFEIKIQNQNFYF